jgi:DNA-binding FrmR family transcriptional regulator
MPGSPGVGPGSGRLDGAATLGPIPARLQAAPALARPVLPVLEEAPPALGDSELDGTFRHAYTRDRSMLIRRLRRIEGQVRGIERMIEREEYCVDILQQTAALRAAVDSVALLVLEDHVQGCIKTVAEQGEVDRYVEEILDVVRRTLGKPVRNPRV